MNMTDRGNDQETSGLFREKRSIGSEERYQNRRGPLVEIEYVLYYQGNGMTRKLE